MYNIAETKARETLKFAFTQALERSGKTVSDVRAVCLGVSGVDNATDEGKMKQWLRFDILYFSHFNYSLF